MKKTMVVRSVAGVVLMVLAVGCATGGGASDEELINAALADWKAALLKSDLDGVMAAYSENFSHSGYDYEAETKAALREFLQASKDEGNWDDVDLSLEDADIEIDGTEAIIYPIDFANNYGAVTIEVTLTKEGKSWMITDMLIEGM